MSVVLTSFALILTPIIAIGFLSYLLISHFEN